MTIKKILPPKDVHCELDERGRTTFPLGFIPPIVINKSISNG